LVLVTAATFWQAMAVKISEDKVEDAMPDAGEYRLKQTHGTNAGVICFE